MWIDTKLKDYESLNFISLFLIKLIKFSSYIIQAYVVLGQYLVLKKNKELFQEWMKDACSANAKQSTDCYQCLTDWCEEFL